MLHIQENLRLSLRVNKTFSEVFSHVQIIAVSVVPLNETAWWYAAWKFHCNIKWKFHASFFERDVTEWPLHQVLAASPYSRSKNLYTSISMPCSSTSSPILVTWFVASSQVFRRASLAPLDLGLYQAIFIASRKRGLGFLSKQRRWIEWRYSAVLSE